MWYNINKRRKKILCEETKKNIFKERMIIMSNSTASRRLQVTIPICDTTVIEWLDKQESASESVRTVIKDYVVRHGMTDAACQPMMIVGNIPEAASNDAETLDCEPNDSTDTAVEEVHVSENTSEMSAVVQEKYESSKLNDSEETFEEFRPVIDEVSIEECYDVIDRNALPPRELFKKYFGCTVEEFDKIYSDCHNPTTDAADSTSEISQQEEK